MLLESYTTLYAGLSETCNLDFQSICSVTWGHYEVIKVLICPSIKNLPHLILHEAILRGQNKEEFLPAIQRERCFIFFHESHLDIYVVTKKAYCASVEISWPAEALKLIQLCMRGIQKLFSIYCTRANKGPSWIVASDKNLLKIGTFYWI